MNFVLLLFVFLPTCICTQIPPLIDISPLFSTLISEKQQLLTQIDHAFKNYGVFIAYGLSEYESLLNSAFESSENLFNLPIQDKNSVSLNNSVDFGRGYLPLGLETGLKANFEKKEGFGFGYSRNTHPKVNLLSSTNKWPLNYQVLANAYNQLENIPKVDPEQVSLSLLNINGKIETARTEDRRSKRQKNERRTKNGGKTNVKK